MEVFGNAPLRDESFSAAEGMRTDDVIPLNAVVMDAL